MRDTIKSILIPSLVVIGIMVFGYFAVDMVISWIGDRAEQELNVGSVSSGSEYHATSTYQIDGACKTDIDRLINYSSYQPTILGSITIVSTTPHVLSIMNATSTLAAGFYTNSSSTFAVLPANLGVGTYVFDAVLSNGLVLDFEAGFCGDYVITYK